MTIQQVLGGYAGNILYVDLTSGRVGKRPLPHDLARSLIGGSGINAKLLFENVPPHTDPLSPQNVLVFGAGPLVGTMVPGAARTSFMAKIAAVWNDRHK